MIYTQNDFRKDIIPEPGMMFIGDDKKFYRVMSWHPRTKDEACIKFTDKEINEGEEYKHKKDFWAVRPLVKEEIDILIKGR